MFSVPYDVLPVLRYSAPTLAKVGFSGDTFIESNLECQSLALGLEVPKLLKGI